MDIPWLRCNIHYYLREKCYGRVKKIIKQAHASNSEFIFYHGVSNILEGQVQKGIVDLTPIQSDNDLMLAVSIALVFGHKASSSLDRETVYSLEAKIKEERKQAGAVSLYYAGLFLSFVEKYDKASEYINKSLKKDQNNAETLILKGWNDMAMSKGELQMSILDCLELALNKSNKNPDGLLGLAKFKFLAKDHDASNLTLDRLIVSGPNQIVPLVEKMRNEFAMQKWEAMYDTMERIFLQEQDNIEALKMRVFIALCKQSDYIEAADQLNRFYTVLENEETYNGYQFYITAQIFSKACARSGAVLTQVYRFAQYASEMYPSNVDYLAEVGYQCLLQGKVKDAVGFFKTASKIDSNSITALCGLTLCQMAESGPSDQISQQIELLLEMQGNQKLPVLHLLSAKLNEKVSPNAIIFLNEAMDSKIAYANRFPYSLAYIRELDPDFLLEVYKEYRKHLPKKPMIIVGYLTYTQEGNNSSVNNCITMLEMIVKACPGHSAAVYELAKLKFQFGFANEAQKMAVQLGELDNTNAGSQILLTQIYIQQQEFAKASQCLETCLSYNFKAKDTAMYNFLQGVILKCSNKQQDALNSLNASLSVVTNKNPQKALDSELNVIDKATLYLLIIELQSALGMSEAGISMQEAIQEFSYTSEESRLLIAKADLALNKGDVDKAIDILNEIKPGQLYYFQAHTKMAHIYLKEKNDRAMFTACFKEVVSNHPMADAHTLMGDAYMSIHEPEEAVASFEVALRSNPGNAALVRRLGAALRRTHEYERALRLLEDAGRADPELLVDYIDLLTKLKRYDKVDSTISEELNKPQNKEKDIDTLKRRVMFLEKQAQVRELQNPTAGNTTLIITEAKDIQASILKRVEIEGRGDLPAHRTRLARLLGSLARARAAREPAVAASLYADALIHAPRDPETLLPLAKLYAQMNQPEKCEKTLEILLNADPNNESAAVMMADLAFRKMDLETAQRHLTQILSVSPASWEALAQLIEIQWRRGKLEEAEPALEAARRAAAGDEPGYNYCAGLFSAHSGKPNAALRQLNVCRRAPAWGARAAGRMALLCLQQPAPDQPLTDGDTRALALRTAERLVTETEPSSRRGLQALLQAAARSRGGAEAVLAAGLGEPDQADPYHILAIAHAYNTVKQPTRAKNILKRTITSIQWTPENADGLERCWLEVAESQVSAGRVEAARELLTKILNHNNSCASAYHHLGCLAEKEQNYKQAAAHFSNAWVYSGRGSGAAGARLAHARLKLRQYPECIAACRRVLATRPDYPRLRKDIMEKAKANLRT